MVVLTNGQLPWDVALQIPEEYAFGWEVALSEFRSGKTFDFTVDAFGHYRGFSKAAPSGRREAADASADGGQT